MVDALSINSGTGDLTEVSQHSINNGLFAYFNGVPPEFEAIDSTGKFVFSTCGRFFRL